MMRGAGRHLMVTLRLHFRNRMALVYGYLFPLVFLGAFAVLYRHEPVPLLRHMGELLTIGVLGGACFGLPTTLVSERERGVWRRYRLLPVPTWRLVATAVLARFLLVASAALLQLAAALALGLTPPAHPVTLAVAFTAVAFAFSGLGLVIAAFADTVPAVQALGQCLFLPMLIVGGVAVPLSALPDWAQRFSEFLPGRYAVDALQTGVTGGDSAALRFNLLALVVIGAAACITGAKLFRWDAGAHGPRASARWWIVPALAAWVAVGLLATWRGAAEPTETAAPARAPQPAWKRLTGLDVENLNYNVPPDDGVVAPIAENPPEDYLRRQVERTRAALPTWPPAREGDEVQRVRNLLCIAAVADAAQMPVEGYLPPMLLEELRATHRQIDLLKILTWIAQHPDEGTVRTDVTELGLPGARLNDSALVRERVGLYAVKFVARLTGRSTTAP